jgi:hypothetical protein
MSLSVAGQGQRGVGGAVWSTRIEGRGSHRLPTRQVPQGEGSPGEPRTGLNQLTLPHLAVKARPRRRPVLEGGISTVKITVASTSFTCCRWRASFRSAARSFLTVDWGGEALERVEVLESEPRFVLLCASQSAGWW